MTGTPKTPRELIVALTECVASYVDQQRYASLLRSIEYRMENEDADREWRAAHRPAVETFDEHDAGIICDLEAMAKDQLAGFWPQALAIGALRLIRRAQKTSTERPTEPQGG